MLKVGYTVQIINSNSSVEYTVRSIKRLDCAPIERVHIDVSSAYNSEVLGEIIFNFCCDDPSYVPKVFLDIEKENVGFLFARTVEDYKFTVLRSLEIKEDCECDEDINQVIANIATFKHIASNIEFFLNTYLPIIKDKYYLDDDIA